MTFAQLPIAEVVPQVIDALRSGNVFLQAEPGAGKSTGLPLALLQHNVFARKIVMLEPRRLAARGVAERLASQLGEPLGQRIGLRMRGNTTVSKNTRIEVVTEGVLTRMLQADPTLDDIGLVIFDEFHERSLHADLGLTLCLEIQQALREDLRILLMSATLDTTQLGAHLDNATQINCAVRQYPVDIVWQGDANTPLPQRVVEAVMKALSAYVGDVLVFLPGVAEIEKTARLLQPRLSVNEKLLRLHGGVDAAAQREATRPALNTHRRVILSTSIAETSITIDGVRIVIDSGLERRGRVDNSSGATRLETVMASQASATQRGGRAGRTAPGVCFRLWGETGHQRRATAWQAEILRADLAPLLMELGQWGVTSVAELPWLERPPAAALTRAEAVLHTLGIWDEGQLTAHGRAVAQLPVHPRFGHMLLWAAKHGAADLGCKIAILLDERERQRRGVDLEDALHGQLSRYQSTRVTQLKKRLPVSADQESSPPAAVVLAQAYPDWIAQRRPGVESRFTLACGAGAVLHQDESLSHREWLVIGQLGGSGREGRIHAAMALDIVELETWAPELLEVKRHIGWDDRLERVIAEQQRVIGSLIIQSQTITDITNTDRATALLSGIESRGLSCLPWTDECRDWQARVELMQRLAPQPGGMQWPEVNDEALLATLESWLLAYLDGLNSLKAVAQLDLLAILSNMLNYQQQQDLNEYLPKRYTVPSGSQIKLEYSREGNPVLAVKLQEMFGCTVNPSIARGLVPLKIELLSPARRPVQVTEDLANFWGNSYPAVKKEMAGRYPKHYWPDDPQNAVPTAKAKPRNHKK